ncbi:unnamed protein product [Tilletia laevis]|uniref:Uncharacterized protein n=2 Tax=Tilletia TaxID=13289 RepID=A0A177U379_9BASI|nr:hypothetical protein CF336_g6672 [Tilletia laevis]KAE8189565.1 hypothetical protein CF328_g6238 [Tilletia controversa]KAE8253366.1 hypothetical protein A4X03_0g5917 [Tilletia caries]KAE8192087.1 hypothetical protein CF335_g5925 [Tilletia laevis]CAD6892614.1 unnamed protein product [Tilletia caries]
MSDCRESLPSWLRTCALTLSIVTVPTLVAAGTINLLISESYTPTVISILTFIAQAAVILPTLLFHLSGRHKDDIQHILLLTGSVQFALALLLLAPGFDTTQERIIAILSVVAAGSSLIVLAVGAYVFLVDGKRPRDPEPEEGASQRLEQVISPPSRYTDLNTSPTLTNGSIPQWLSKQPKSRQGQSTCIPHHMNDSQEYEVVLPADQAEVEIENLLSTPPATPPSGRSLLPAEAVYPESNSTLGLFCQAPYSQRKGSAPILTSMPGTQWSNGHVRPTVLPFLGAFAASSPNLGSSSLLYNNDSFTAPSSPRSYITANIIPSPPASRKSTANTSLPHQRPPARVIRTPNSFRTNFHHPLDVEPVTAATEGGDDDDVNGLTPRQSLSLGRTLPNGSQERLALEAKAAAVFLGGDTTMSPRRMSASSTESRIITSPPLPGGWQPWISSPLASGGGDEDGSHRNSSSSQRTTPSKNSQQGEAKATQWAVTTAGFSPSPTFRFLSEWTKRGVQGVLMPASSSGNTLNADTDGATAKQHDEAFHPSSRGTELSTGGRLRTGTADSALTFFPTDTRKASAAFSSSLVATPRRPTTGNSTVSSISGSHASPRVICVAGVALSVDEDDEDEDEDEDEEENDETDGIQVRRLASNFQQGNISDT